MKYILILMMTVLLIACGNNSKYDSRLNGIWRVNRVESIAAAHQRDPHQKDALQEKVARSKSKHPRLILAYSKSDIQMASGAEGWTMKYAVVEKGEDYVVIQIRDSENWDGLKMRIRFVDGGNGYWTDTRKLLGSDTPEDKFDRVTEPGVPAKYF